MRHASSFCPLTTVALASVALAVVTGARPAHAAPGTTAGTGAKDAAGSEEPVSYGFPTERWQLAPFAGYQTWGAIDIPAGGQLRINDGWEYGAVVDVRTRGMALVELAFTRMESQLNFETMGTKSKVFGLDISYLHLGAQVELLPGIVRPFAGVTFGITLLNPHVATDDVETRFSAAVSGGVKVLFTKTIGLRGQARLTTTFLSSDSSVFCAVDGCGLSLGGTGLLQGDFSLGFLVLL